MLEFIFGKKTPATTATHEFAAAEQDEEEQETDTSPRGDECEHAIEYIATYGLRALSRKKYMVKRRDGDHHYDIIYTLGNKDWREWPRELRNFTVHVDENGTPWCLRHGLQRGAEVLTGFHADTSQDYLRQKIHRLNKFHRDLIQKIDDGAEHFGYLTEKADGQLMSVTIYHQDMPEYEMAKGYEDFEHGPYIGVIHSNTCYKAEERMVTKFKSMFEDMPAEIMALYHLSANATNAADQPMTLSWEMVAQTILVRYDEEHLYFLGATRNIRTGGRFTPYTVIAPEKGPPFHIVNNTKEIVEHVVALEAAIDAGDKSFTINFEGFVLFSPNGEQWDYAKIKSLSYYTANSSTNNAKVLTPEGAALFLKTSRTPINREEVLGRFLNVNMNRVMKHNTRRILQNLQSCDNPGEMFKAISHSQMMCMLKELKGAPAQLLSDISFTKRVMGKYRDFWQAGDSEDQEYAWITMKETGRTEVRQFLDLLTGEGKEPKSRVLIDLERLDAATRDIEKVKQAKDWNHQNYLSRKVKK